MVLTLGIDTDSPRRIIRLALPDADQTYLLERRRPYIQYNKGVSKERKELISLSEALVRLDMAGAVKDIRRFNFVCKLLQLIMKSKLADLSGTAQKNVFVILEALLNHALKSEFNLGTLRDLLLATERALQEGHINHIGSSCLWSQHQDTVKKLVNRLSQFQIKQREDDGRVTFSDLPDDCIRCILRCLGDHRDVICTAQTSTTIYDLSHEMLLWRQLCFFHFTDKQLVTFLPESMDVREVDWKYIYRRCYKRFGRRDTFADTLALCSYCSSIFWQSLGHPCVKEGESVSKELSPENFMKLFSM
ncbi:F-box only protein 25-like isoform X2 [Gigantopelta aegis]|uniref:F-box only protein 25-like isoform X2 n=1 Tax=Gigantopelta aegis TaxID=1735272 RepID=UPI001B888103|nr:F-box only protein 25-like isoform X2 [Gigantopelta aegis]